MKYFILGSCVTRDIFGLVNKNENIIVDYYARTSLSSLVSKPIEAVNKDINLTSEFQKRIVRRDLEKTFFDDVKAKEFDYLVIDFIDERFDLLQVGESIITRSNEFVNSGLEKELQTIKVKKDLDNWKRDCKVFIDKLSSIVPVEKIILHYALWSEKHIDNDVILESSNLNYIKKNNEMLMAYYDTFIELLPVKVVKTKKEFLANAQHKWGLSPFHYVDEYYNEIYEQMKKNGEKMDIVNLKIEHDKLVVTVDSKDLTEHSFAYYLVKDNEAVEKIWYTSNTTHIFNIENNGAYSVNVFIKNNSTEKIEIIKTKVINFINGRKGETLQFIRIEGMEMTNYCNLSCVNCCTPTTKYKKGFIADRTVLATLAWTQKGQTLNYHRQGEPLLHKSLEKYVRWGVEVGIKPVISSNGELLTEQRLEDLYNSGLRHIEITLHTLKSIEAFKMACNFFESNNITTVNFSERFKKFEDDVVYFTGKILEFDDIDENSEYKKQIDLIEEKYPKLIQRHKTHTWAGNVEGTKQENDNTNVSDKIKNCYFIQRRVVNVRWDGTVVGCCFDSENDNEIGHITDFANLKIDLAKYKLCKQCDSNWATL